MSADDLKITLLTKRHDRDSFDCGESALNEFLRKYARQNQQENVGRTWVLTAADSTKILGFYTLSVASVSHDRFPPEETKRVPRYPLPVAHLGRFAIDLSEQGKGVGEHLLMHALEQIYRVSQVVGIFAVEVRAKHVTAKRFYERYGFVAAIDDGLHLHLSGKKLQRLLGED